ncbi:o-succinylbenzoate synthase [soil metagenome]
MNLAGFDLYRYSLPLSRPLTLKGTTLHHREGLLLRLSGDDGSEGWGESAPLPGFSEEGLNEAAMRLRRLAGFPIGREVKDDWTDRDGAFGRELEHIASAPSVRFGLELAVWNLYGASSGMGLAELLAPSPRATVPVNGLLSGAVDEVLEEASRMGNAGYRTVKLKVGSRAVADDIRLVRALGEELGDEISLRLDANRAWDYEEAVEFVRRTPCFEYVEEPLADPARLPELAQESGVPVALDESLVGMEPDELEEHRYARAVVLKPTLLGGISQTLQMAERALRLGMTPVVSSAYETGVGTTALVAMAASIGDRPVPAGLDTYRMLAGDVLGTPLELPAPSVDVAATTDASRRVDVRRLERL